MALRTIDPRFPSPLALLLCVGCQPTPPMVVVTPAAPPAKVRPQPAPIEAAALKFSSPDAGNLFLACDKTAREFAAQGYEHRSYELGGNFVTAVWSKGADFTRPIQLRGPQKKLQAIHRIRVDAIVIPFPQAVTGGLAVEHVPADPEKWCVSLSYHEGANNAVTGPGWSIYLFRWDATKYGRITPFQPWEQAKDRIDLPVRGYAVAATPVPFHSDLSYQENFLRHMESAEAMRDAFLADLEQVEAKSLALIESHGARKEVSEEYRGGGIPPRKHAEPLTADDEAAQLAKAKQYFATQAQLMRAHYEEMYGAVRASFPLEKCFPELK